MRFSILAAPAVDSLLPPRFMLALAKLQAGHAREIAMEMTTIASSAAPDPATQPKEALRVLVARPGTGRQVRIECHLFTSVSIGEGAVFVSIPTQLEAA
jgi:hypothetical protein